MTISIDELKLAKNDVYGSKLDLTDPDIMQTKTGKVIHKKFDDVRIFVRGQDILLSKNFHLNEFECKCGECDTVIICGTHLQRLQLFREKLNKIVHITSGYRCATWNEKIGGSKKSQHIQGKATDIVVHDEEPARIQELAEFFDFGGIGRYKSFTHVDSREGRARW